MSPLIFFLYSSQIQSFRFSVSVLTPLALRVLPLYRCATPRNAAGYGRERGCDLILLLLLSQFFNPSVLRTPPLYFAVHNTGEEDCNAVFFPILFCSAPQCCGTRQGRGCDLILLLLLSQFFNPSVLRTPPLYFAVHNTGEEDCNAVFFPILFCSAP